MEDSEENMHVDIGAIHAGIAEVMGSIPIQA